VSQPVSETDVPRVLLVCSGLAHARRGFETFARECFDAMRDAPGIRIELVKGSGLRGPGERAVPTLRRDRSVARGLGRVLGRPPFRIEALAFAMTLSPLIVARRPDVVYLSEWDTARALAAVRSATRQRFKLILSNGGFAETGFEHLDYVQELTPAAFEYVMARGADPRRHSVLPLGFRIPRQLALPSPAARAELRLRRGLPIDRPIILSVAALNRHHKRLDYLIDELARLPEPRPFLLLAGEPEDETPSIRSLATARLGEDGYKMLTVPAEHVVDLYRLSDVFVLASVAEAQGRVLVEAMSHGLPCVAHDSPVMRFALGEHGRFGDFTVPGELGRLLAEPPNLTPHQARAAHRHVYGRFSWEQLGPRYVELFQRVARANKTVSSSTAE
jgi:glycosyltransferase involved in cell wall biosynthesis